jgi:UDP-2,4-diacetamido-2,4,6-trideoxy-beta-L-altropyranose hydrolase
MVRPGPAIVRSVAADVVIVADAGDEAGLGHLSRSSAVAVALRSRGVEPRCFAHGPEGPLERDGIAWLPFDGISLHGGVVVVDSYRLPLSTLEPDRLVLMHDHGEVPAGIALVVSAAGRASDRPPRLGGLRYAALRAAFWGLPARPVRSEVERVLVTTGSGRFGRVGREIAAELRGALPRAQVVLVRGPYDASEAPIDVATIETPDSLLTSLLDADLVVSAAGQTMLEAAAAGTPCVAVSLVDNQSRQARRLARLGAARVVPRRRAAEEARRLAGDPDARRTLSRRGQSAVDGYGALRVAFHVAQLAAERQRG